MADGCEFFTYIRVSLWCAMIMKGQHLRVAVFIQNKPATSCGPLRNSPAPSNTQGIWPNASTSLGFYCPFMSMYWTGNLRCILTMRNIIFIRSKRWIVILEWLICSYSILCCRSIEEIVKRQILKLEYSIRYSSEYVMTHLSFSMSMWKQRDFDNVAILL